MEFRVLGPLEVLRDGVPVDLGGAKQRAVLAALLAERGRAVGADRLADLVWDGEPPAAAATTLRSYISNLRKALRPDDVLVTRNQGYALELPPDVVDAGRFESAVADARGAIAAGDNEGARSRFADALALWRGGAYADVADASFAQAESARLEELRLNAIEDLVECRLLLGEAADLTGELEALSREHPMRERLWAARMRALYRSGRQGDALKVYEEARAKLASELGIDPSPELRKLHESILRQEDEPTAAIARARPGKQTLSFLFTDIELSTEMLLGAEDEYAYAQTMEEHRAALRDAFVSHGGQRIRTWGDAFFSAFDTATDAVRAAIAAQLALLEACQEGVRVRMGVHSGEAAVVADDYVGIAVHAAARIGAAAHGAQILVSQSTKELLDADVGDGVTFLDLGPHQLKDIPEPMRLYQLTHAKLPKTFPPPRTLSAMPHNLPAPATSFIGRADDVRVTAEALERARVVTLTGVGGVGKTRLAQEVGAEVLPRYPDGVWLCELAPIGEPDAIVHTIARALRVQQQQDLTFLETVIAFLRRQRALLILDNCEHVLEPVAELVEEIVRRCPSVAVLATSREGIGVEGEQIRPVRSLTMPPDDADCDEYGEAEAIALFVDRARAVRPDFELGANNAKAVADICRRLDGIPLAIELAAARVTSMGPLEIAARLDRRFRFLRSGRRTAVERHRTLQAAADWSYTLLSEDEQQLFARLSVFGGGFNLEAAERVCGDGLGSEVADLLDGLVSKSLVNADTSDEDTRYSMLETLRQYAQTKLEEGGNAEATRVAHFRCFLDLAIAAEEGLIGPDDVAWACRIEREIDNLLAAYEWAITSEDVDGALRMLVALQYVAAFGSSEMNDSWALRGLALPGAEAHEAAPVVFGLAAGAAWTRGDHRAARELAERALALASDPDDPRRMHAIGQLGILALLDGWTDEGLALTNDSIRLARIGNDRAYEAQWSLVRAMFTSYAGDRATARAYIEEARPLLPPATMFRAFERYITGEVILDADPPGAIAALDEAVELATTLRHQFLINIARLSAISLRGRHRDVYEAIAAYPELMESWRRMGNWQQQWTTVRNLLEHFAAIGRDEAAVTLHFAAMTSSTAGPLRLEQGERFERLIGELEERMGTERFTAARERGEEMSGEEAIAFALAETRAALSERADQQTPVS